MLKLIHSFLIFSVLAVGCKGTTEQEDLKFDGGQALKDGGEDQIEIKTTSSDETYSTDEDIAIEIQTISIPPEWDERKIYDPQNGVANFNGDKLVYEPFENFFGSDIIKIEYISAGNVVFTRNVILTIDPINDIPFTQDDTKSTSAATEVTIDVLANDGDVDDGDEIVLKSVSSASNGTVSINNGKIVYQSDAAFNGSETLSYTIEDKSGATAQGTLSISVSYNGGGTGEGNSELLVPVRLTFIEHSDGSKLTGDYAAYAANVITKLNETYHDGTTQHLKFVLDSYSNLINDDFYITPSNSITSALSYFRTNHNVSGKVNIYFIKEIVGGVAGVAYVNQVTTTTAMFEKMSTAALEKNVVGHEIGHNVGFSHTADQSITEDRYIGYKYVTSCNLDTFYFQRKGVVYPPGDANWDGWHYGANLMYPIASPDPSTLFTGKYDNVFSSIMACWHKRSGW